MKDSFFLKSILFKMPRSKLTFIIDNNFLFNYTRMPNKKKNKFIDLVKKDKLIFYLTDVLVGEILHLVGTDEWGLGSDLVNQRQIRLGRKSRN